MSESTQDPSAEPGQPIVLVSAVVLRDDQGRVLTVRRRGTGRFMFPGGRPEPGETFEQAVIRKTAEELGVLLDPELLVALGTFTAAAADEDDHLVQAWVFEHPQVVAESPGVEIEELRWQDPSLPYPNDLAPLLAEAVFPMLSEGLTQDEPRRMAEPPTMAEPRTLDEPRRMAERRNVEDRLLAERMLAQRPPSTEQPPSTERPLSTDPSLLAAHSLLADHPLLSDYPPPSELDETPGPRWVTIFAGSSTGVDPAYASATAELGEHLAARGIGIVYGGGGAGLMGALADAALKAGGEVVGVIPQALMDREMAHAGLSRLEIVADMHERKRRLAALGDAFVALPGGIGTLEELFEVWTWQQLGFHAKPIALYDVGGFWQPLVALVEHMVAAGFLGTEHRDLLIVRETPTLLVEALGS